MSAPAEGASIVPPRTLDPATVAVGDELPPVSKVPTTRQLVMFAGASGDFYEIHYDNAVAVESGLPGVIVHGYLKMAWLGELVTTWAGPDALVVDIDVSYRGTDLPNDEYLLKGRVTAVTAGEAISTVDLEVWGEGAAGTKTTIGTVTVQLPAESR